MEPVTPSPPLAKRRPGRDALSTKPGRDVMLALGRYRLLTTFQLNRLLYANRSPTFVYTNLAKLGRAGYATDDNWVSLRATGAPRKLWGLTYRGAVALAREGVEDVAIPHHRARRSTATLEHLHDLNDVMITCELFGTRCEGVDLLGWRHDDELHRHPMVVELPDGSVTQLVPDGWVAYGIGRQSACLAVETDRAFESERQWRAKVRAYVACLAGDPSPYRRVFGRENLVVLTVIRPKEIARVKSPEGRLAELKGWTERELEALDKLKWGGLFRFTTQRAEETEPRAFFADATWTTPFVEGCRPLLGGEPEVA